MSTIRLVEQAVELQIETRIIKHLQTLSSKLLMWEGRSTISSQFNINRDRKIKY